MATSPLAQGATSGTLPYVGHRLYKCCHSWLRPACLTLMAVMPDSAASTGYQSYIAAGPDDATYMRSIVLFGGNTACYKFALTRALLDLAAEERTVVTLPELAPYFARHVTAHVRTGMAQGTVPKSTFLDAAAAHLHGQIDEDALYDVTTQHAFRYVLDLYHRLPEGETSVQFYAQEKRPRRLVLTDQLLGLLPEQRQQLTGETEARWQLVEHAWTQSKNGEDARRPIAYDPESENLVLLPWRNIERKKLTQFRPSLSGYQKSRCFYCFKEIDVMDGKVCQVDHFFPWRLGFRLDGTDINGVWNLVLACASCNGWAGGKSDAIPEKRFLIRIHRRNSYLIDSHHPLRNALIEATGRTEEERWRFLSSLYDQVREWQPRQWSCVETQAAAF